MKTESVQGVSIPREPTPEMLAACNTTVGKATLAKWWRAMYDVAAELSGLGVDDAAPLTEADAAYQVPVPLVEELRIEASLVPHRRGQLYAQAADRIEQLEIYLANAEAVSRCAEAREVSGLSGLEQTYEGETAEQLLRRFPDTPVTVASFIRSQAKSLDERRTALHDRHQTEPRNE
jgi:hypothetical protein